MLNRQALSNPAFIDKIDAAMRQAAATSLAQSIELPSTTLATGRANVDNRRHRPALTVAHIRNQPGAFRFYDMTGTQMKNITPLMLEVLREHSDAAYYNVANDIRQCGQTTLDIEAGYDAGAMRVVMHNPDGTVKTYEPIDSLTSADLVKQARSDVYKEFADRAWANNTGDDGVTVLPFPLDASDEERRDIYRRVKARRALSAPYGDAVCTCAGMHGTHAVWCMASKPKSVEINIDMADLERRVAYAHAIGAPKTTGEFLDYNDLRAFINGSRQP